MNPTSNENIESIINDKKDEINYLDPKFNWDMIDDGSITINDDNPVTNYNSL